MQPTRTHTHIFTASEVAEFEYCPLAWWHEQFEPWARAETEELFARLVELEHIHNAQAPALPEYRMIEQLLLRRGAFEEGRRQHEEHAEEVEGVEKEVEYAIDHGGRARLFARAAIILGALALLLLIFALFWR
ncbi:MAG TPA: hypothetical protein VFV38_02140 [Ktedonobacteraceae bacterium]|nr:hypothetical protein [Ktedonobacteraceae bacterium]